MDKPIPELRTISKDAVPRAIQKAERYRLLNQSWATESICLDILAVDHDNQPVLVMLLLAITDQFGGESQEKVRRAKEVASRLTDPYQRAYYSGIIAERLGHAQINHGGMHSETLANHALREAMQFFEKAATLRTPGNDDAILRFNTCVRVLGGLRPHDAGDGRYEPVFGE